MAILKSRLFLKIMISYMVLLLAVLVIMYLYIAYRVHENYISLERDRLRSVAEVLARAIPQERSMTALQPWAQAYGNPGGFRITVIDPSGQVLADNQGSPAQMDNHSNRPEVRQAWENGMGSSVRFSRTLGTNELYLAYRVQRSDGNPQMLRVAIPVQEISQGFRTAQRGILFISMFLFLLALGLGYFFTRSLTNRIESIQKFSENVALGNLDARVKEVTADELGSLAESLNTTANALQRTIDELREEKNRVAAILEGIRAGVLATDAEGHVTLMNPVLARILQVDLKASLGKRIMDLVRNAELKEIFDRVLAEKKEVTATVELVLATTRSFDVVAVPLREVAENPAGVVAVLHDITRLKQLESIRKDFVANVSHELRTPLTSIRGFAETLLDGALEDRKNNRRFVEIIRAHAIRLSDLTSDLLTLATLESESFELNYELIDVPSLMHDVVESIRTIGQRKRQEIVTRIAEVLPILRADRGRLRQVLINLLDNAVKFTPEEGRILLEVGLASHDKGVSVRVKDSGIGIPPSDLPRIFERFYRVDKARSREQGGTGLGLSIVKHIVEAHGGEIEVKSTVGQGSEFCFTLPLAKSPARDQGFQQAFSFVDNPT
jgi:two-component system, OmpR family, phosphate regulon sensor histidine kinase PhoR